MSSDKPESESGIPRAAATRGNDKVGSVTEHRLEACATEEKFFSVVAPACVASEKGQFLRMLQPPPELQPHPPVFLAGRAPIS